MRDQEDEIVAAGPLTAEAGLIALRAIGEPTRLRILMLLATGELTVKGPDTGIGAKPSQGSVDISN